MKNDFPIFKNHPEICYLDSGASTQKPQIVIDTLNEIYTHQYSNVHRGVHRLSQALSARYEDTRRRVAQFINAAHEEEIIFTKGTTEALNLVAYSLSELVLNQGDVVLISALEHHANIVPWQIACQKHGATLRVIPVDDNGELLFDATLFNDVKILAMTWVSNALGTINDIQRYIQFAKSKNIYTVIDAAQAVAHLKTDVQNLGCDFLAFSGHKIYGPTAVGVLYGRLELLKEMPVFQSGGDMILSVTFEKTIYAPPPLKFEAGTPPIVEVIGLGAALDWVEKHSLEKISHHEEQLRLAAENELQKISAVQIIGTARKKAAVISFVLEDIHPHDAGTIFDQLGVAVRVGHHCAEPVMQRFQVPATIRATFSAYNDFTDVERLVCAIKKTLEIFK